MYRTRAALLFALVPGAFSPLPGAGVARQADAAYRDPGLPVAERIADLLSRMTREEKFWQLYMSPGSLDDSTHDYSHGAFGLQIATAPDAPAGDAAEAARAHAMRINEIQRYFVEETRLGIPIIPFDEAVHGLVRDGATVFPQAIGLAATWDTALVGRVARAIARETRSRGVRQVLSPVVNLATDVRWGRTEETYGEDPYLSAVMGRAFAGAFERAGVVATPKHFVANVGEGGRDSYPIYLSERLLRELHFPPFRTAIRETGARSVMTAYNSVDGAPATQSPWLLDRVLKGEWGFEGFVISDAAATGGATVLHMTESSTPEAARQAWEAGLDVVFQSTWEQHRPYLAAFRSGGVADSVLDAAVARVLRAKLELGLFEAPFVDPDSAAAASGDPGHLALAREAARTSLVLLENDGLLPLDPAPARIAVIGTDASQARLGGYSGPGARAVSILDGLREALGVETEVAFAPGPGRSDSTYEVVPSGRLSFVRDGERVAGLRGEYFDNNALEGEPRIVRVDERVDFRWTLSSPGRGIPYDWFSARWTGTLDVPPGTAPRLGVEGNDGYRLWIDDELVVDNWRKRSYGTRFAEDPLEPGRSYAIRLEYFESTGNARLKLVWNAERRPDWRAQVDSAVAAARAADVAIVVAGIEEGEFRDRASLALPGHQETLIRAVAATGTPTVVVIVGGSAVTMSAWLDGVDAVLLAWYPGEQGGPAVAEVLLGRAAPAGRLPITFAISEGQLPLRYNHRPTGRGDDYLDLTGQPLFPFGHGLSYTSFEYTGLAVEPDTIDLHALEEGATARVRLRVRNTGDRAGDEVVQLYLRDELASLARPVQQLAGFRRVRLSPGEERAVTFEVGFESLKMLDEEMEWIVEPGGFRVQVGSSSKDIRLRGELVVR